MSSKKAKTKTTKKYFQHSASNVLAMFDQPQIQEFNEAFDMIDQNKDGFINKKNLCDMLFSLGKHPTDVYLNAMMIEAPRPINFTLLLMMFGEKLNGTDSEDVIRNSFATYSKDYIMFTTQRLITIHREKRNAFACFDEEATGTIQEDYLRELPTMRDQFIDEEVDELYRDY